MRGILLKTSLNNIEQIENDTFYLLKVKGIEKIKLKSIFQLELISHIMMYVEDLIIISESLRTEISYYKLLDTSEFHTNDVGEIIKNFFNNINSFSDEDFFKIMSYVNPKHLDLKENEKNIVKKNIEKNIIELKRMLNQIGDFSKTNHSIFRRFKHAGSPLLLGGTKTDSKLSFLSSFDSYVLVSNGLEPFESVIPIPFSKDVLTGYQIIIQGIQVLLQDIIRNHIVCIQRNQPSLIPNENYSPRDFSKDEMHIYKNIITNFYEIHPPVRMDELTSFNFDNEVKTDEIGWYLNLPNFLKECSQRKESIEYLSS